jgi:hypothetical protein
MARSAAQGMQRIAQRAQHRDKRQSKWTSQIFILPLINYANIF